jgi:hypothetical protein
MTCADSAGSLHTSRGGSAGLPVVLAKCAENGRSISDQSIASSNITRSWFGLRCSANGQRSKSLALGFYGFGPIKTLAQFTGIKFDYLKILQIARHLFNRKPAWLADLRVIQDGLLMVSQSCTHVPDYLGILTQRLV